MRGIFKAAVALLLAFSQTSDAHSVERNPLSYLTRVDDATLHTTSGRVNAYSTFELTFLLHNKKDKIRLSLEPNHDVVGDDTHVNYLNPDGSIHRSERLSRADHKVYKGAAFVQHPGHQEWINSGWARVTLHRDGQHPIFEGSFHLDGDNHHVQTSTNYRRTQLHEDPVIEFSDDEYMIVWRDTDVISDANEYDEPDVHGELKRGLEGSTCSSDELEFNTDDNHPIYRGLDVRESVDTGNLLFGRQIDGTAGGTGAGVNLQSTIGSTVGCQSTRRVALIGMAVDCTYRADFDTEQTMRTNIISMVNTASQLYESTFNISLGIANLTINSPDCPGTPPASAPWNVPCSPSVKMSDRLNLFSSWRAQFNDRNAYWTLLTKCPEDGGAVGIAWLGELCSVGTTGRGGNGTANGANVVARISSEWQVFAHETGHTFGAVHDCTASSCADGTATMQKCCPSTANSCDARGRFLMNPSASSTITTFSPCTVGNICSAMGRNSVNSQCLANNRDVTVITGSQCGNGIVETGEDCDCGGTAGCGANSCCDPTTCKFRANAVCDPTNEECCTTQCRFASSGTVCRASTGTCDIQETCNGVSSLCPRDVTSPDGQSCGNGLACASGQCTSRNLQCRTVVGTLTSNNDTSACSPRDCLLSCSSPRLGTESCYNMNQYFLNGTPCQGGGKCNNGRCDGTNWLVEAREWIDANKPIFIPVVCIVGGLILIAIVSCIVSCCRGGRRRSKMPLASPPPLPAWRAHPDRFGPAGLARPAPTARGPGGRGPRAMTPPDPRLPAYHETQQWGVRRVNTATRYA